MKQAGPEGEYPTLWDWVETSRAGQFRFHELQNVIYMEETLSLAPPKTVRLPLDPVFLARSIAIPKAFVAVLPEGRYWAANSRSFAVIAPDGKLVWDVSMQFRRPNAKHPVYHKRDWPEPEKIAGTVAVLSFVWDSNYYHWLGDVLARIHLLDKSGIAVDKYLIHGKSRKAFQKETLALLGIPKHRLIRSVPGMHVQASRLVVPSLEMYRLDPFVPHSFPPWASRYLRTALLERLRPEPLDGYERVYIGREDAPNRKVTNEEQVIGRLEKHGFRKVLLSALSVAEQARLFASAERIAAPHGAGLANLLFCRPGAKVLELYAPNYMNPLYWFLGNQLGLDYFYLAGEGERKPVTSGIGDVECRTDNMTIDPDLLDASIELMNGGNSDE